MSERELAQVDTLYLYTGPASGVTLKLRDGSAREVLLHRNREVRLPADHPFVVRLEAQKYVTKVAPPAENAADVGESKTPPPSSSRPARAKASTQEDSQ